MDRGFYIVILFLIGSFTYAQSAKKSLTYIIENKTEVFLPRSYSTGIVHGNYIEFTPDHIKLSSNNGHETLIKWNQIINVSQIDHGEYGELEIVSKEILEEETVFINLSMQDDNIRSDFLKSIKKIAKRQGAKFVKIEVNDGY